MWQPHPEFCGSPTLSNVAAQPHVMWQPHLAVPTVTALPAQGPAWAAAHTDSGSRHPVPTDADSTSVHTRTPTGSAIPVAAMPVTAMPVNPGQDSFHGLCPTARPSRASRPALDCAICTTFSTSHAAMSRHCNARHCDFSHSDSSHGEASHCDANHSAIQADMI